MDSQLKQEIIDLFATLIKPHNDRLNNLSRLGKVLLVKDGKTQSVQTKTANNEVADVKFIEDYGFTCKPKKNSECVLLNIQGNPGNVVALVIGSREFRFKDLKDRELGMYDESGNLFHIKNGGNIDFTAPTAINQTAPTININGSSDVNITTKTAAVQTETLTVEAKKATIDSQKTTIKATTAIIDATTAEIKGIVKLAGGGQPVARVGDEVVVDPNTHKGTITSGSIGVTAG